MVTPLATAPVISSAAFVAVALTREADATSLNAANYAAFDIDTRAIDAAPAPSTVVGPGCVCGGGGCGRLEVLLMLPQTKTGELWNAPGTTVCFEEQRFYALHQGPPSAVPGTNNCNWKSSSRERVGASPRQA